MEKKEINKKYVLIGLILITLGIIGFIFILNLDLTNYSLDQIKCLADKSLLYSSSICSHCIIQNKELGKYRDIFKTIECDNNISICVENNITGTPTWIINNKTYNGVHSIKQLIFISNCS